MSFCQSWWIRTEKDYRRFEVAIVRIKDAVIDTKGYAAFCLDGGLGEQYLVGRPWHRNSVVLLSGGPLSEEEGQAALDAIYKAMDFEYHGQVAAVTAEVS